MREIYFDNSATTRVSERAAQAALTAMREEYGNPSSVHHKGARAAAALRQARSELASQLGVSSNELYFTSGGTESNNTAILGAIASRPAGKGGDKIILSTVEHPSVSVPARQLQSRGYQVIQWPVDERGCIRLDLAEDLLDEGALLVSVMQVNNETGAVQPLAELGELIRRRAPQALFHVDGVQGFGRLPARLPQWGCQAYTASGHKLHGPKGCGLLALIRKLPALISGGGQEGNFRSGTENMPGILALAAAAEEACAGMEQHAAQMRQIKGELVKGLMSALPDIYVNGPPLPEAAPHIVNLSFVGARSEVLLHYLEERGLYVSAGSACSSRSTKGSTTLMAMGLPPERVDSALRFSFSRYNTMDEARQAVEIIVPAVGEVRRLLGMTKKRH